MLFSDSYKTIASSSTALFKDRGSKFLSFAYPVTTENEVKEILIQLRKEHPSAVHFCYAFFIGTNQEGYRSNDDGEPAGSAGKPILNQLKSFGLTNVLVVVVRYFGGTLLGVPGLINAYKESTRLALAEATVVERFVQEVYEVKVNYPQLNTLLKYIREENAIVIKQAMDLEVSIIFSVRKSLADTLIKKINKIENSMLTYQKII